ncbi:glycosyltransferase [Rheinheimera mangrovi]|uniref:glycosyltransferase n=1 Tax=Rheinheimera mangrovi TaxID=2498451 RepID=UPI000F8C3FF6|nr:glycosyltransferase [Rheinheimera mangrovi]
MRVSYVVTNFNNTDFTEKMLESLKHCSNEIHVFVVDNGSSKVEQGKLVELSKLHSFWVTAIFNENNLGYFEGLNVGIRRARQDFPHVELMVVGNNDLIFPENFLQQLEQSADVVSRYPVLSPDIRMLDGTPQNPHVIKSISKVREVVYDLYHSSYWLAGLIVKLAKLTHGLTDREDEKQYEVAQEIYQGYGACYVLTPLFFKNFNDLWAPTFLMYEEFFLSKQLEEKGFKTYYEPRISVTHYCHASTGMIPGELKWQYSCQAHKEYRKYVKVWR